MKYDTGANPAMAVTGSNVVVEVHKGSSNNHLYYRVGCLDLSTERVKWEGSNGHKYDTGDRPSLLITDDNQVIEIHNGASNTTTLYYSIGKLDPDNLTLTWLSIGNKYDTGENVSVMMDSTGLLMEVHNGSHNNNLYYRIGSLGENYISWHGSGGTKYDTGLTPSLTSVPGAHDIIIECHTSSGSTDLYNTSIRFDVELVNSDPSDEMEQFFATEKTEFTNDAPTTLTQKWELK